MPIRLVVEGHDAGVTKRLQRLIAAGADLRKPLLRTGLFLVRRARERLAAGRKSTSSSNRLAASLTARAEPQRLIIGSNLEYAAAQQLGHPGIRPKGKYLAIPLTATLRRSGLWPRDWPAGRLRFVPIAGGKALLVERGTADGQGREEARYLLEPGPVVIKAKRYLRWDPEARKRGRVEMMRHLGLTK